MLISLKQKNCQSGNQQDYIHMHKYLFVFTKFDFIKNLRVKQYDTLLNTFVIIAINGISNEKFIISKQKLLKILKNCRLRSFLKYYTNKI